MREFGPHTQKKNSKRGHGGIEPPTSPTLKENHTTRPMPHTESLPWHPPAQKVTAGAKPKVECLEWDSNPRLLRDSNLSRAPWTARPSKPEARVIAACAHLIGFFLCAKHKKNHIWSIGVSIPVPRACKARTLPIELMPLKNPKPSALAGN